MWWSNGDSRRWQKDNIKMIIKRKKLSEKSSQVLPPGADTPPGLSHSLPTSATFSDSVDRTRSGSVESSFSLDFDFNAGPAIADYTAYNAQIHTTHAQYAPLYSEFAPYEVDVKTERQVFMHDGLTRRESTVSTFSTYHAPQDPSLPSYPGEGEYFDELYSERRASMPEEVLSANFFDYGLAAPRPLALDLEEGDQRLLDHFILNVLPSIFPVLETNQPGSARSDLILPALETNKCYLHCCLSIAAQHYKATAGGAHSDTIDADIMRHRYATISELCGALNRDEEHQQILEATLGMIFFQCSVGRVDDSLPDIPWHQHFQAAISLVQKLELPKLVTAMAEHAPAAPFNMTLTAWIDILGATLQGRAPTFAHTYREKHLSAANPSLGLRELTGCDDRVLYLISEIACLDALKRDGMDEIQLCHHVHSLGDQIGLTEVHDAGVAPPFDAAGHLDPRQLSRNITAAFRLAARIYLCSLVPGFSPAQASSRGLVAKLTSVLELIPAGAGGFDRSMVWVYLMGGSASTAGSSFRSFFEQRVAGLGEQAEFGSFGRVVCLLREVWAKADAMPEESVGVVVEWREVMQSKGWDFLLI